MPSKSTHIFAEFLGILSGLYLILFYFEIISFRVLLLVIGIATLIIDGWFIYKIWGKEKSGYD